MPDTEAKTTPDIEKMTPRERLIYSYEQARKLGTGTVKLHKPLRSRSEDVPELNYDLTKITGMEYAACMDSDPSAGNIDKLSYKQAVSLFALGVEKCMRGTVDARDVKEQLGIEDAMTATRIATVFFVSSSRLGDMGVTAAQ